jgi:hypothetical protein
MGLIYWMRRTHMMFPDNQLARIRLVAYPLVEKPGQCRRLRSPVHSTLESITGTEEVTKLRIETQSYVPWLGPEPWSMTWTPAMAGARQNQGENKKR